MNEFEKLNILHDVVQLDPIKKAIMVGIMEGINADEFLKSLKSTYVDVANDHGVFDCDEENTK